MFDYGGERGATPLGWQGANIGGHGFWTVGALRRIRVAVKKGSNTDLRWRRCSQRKSRDSSLPSLLEIIARPAKLGVKASRFPTVYGKNTSGDLVQGANLTQMLASRCLNCLYGVDPGRTPTGAVCSAAQVRFPFSARPLAPPTRGPPRDSCCRPSTSGLGSWRRVPWSSHR